MTFTEYYALVELELEVLGFGNAVNYYRPPVEVISSFIVNMCKHGFESGLSPKDTANIVQVGFECVAETMFPSTKQ